MSRQAGLSSGEVAVAKNRRSVKFEQLPEKPDVGLEHFGAETETAVGAGGHARLQYVPPAAVQRLDVQHVAESEGHHFGKQDLGLQHRAGLLHRPPQIHMKSSYQNDFGQARAQLSKKTPILEANRMLMRDGQGQVANAFSTPAVLPFQAATEYQRNFQAWAPQPATGVAPAGVRAVPDHGRKPGGVEYCDLLVEDMSDDEDSDDDAQQHQPVAVHTVPQHPPAGVGRPAAALENVQPPPAAARTYAVYPPGRAGGGGGGRPSQPAGQQATFPKSQSADEERRLANHERNRRFKTEYQRTFCEPVERMFQDAPPQTAATASTLPAWYDQVVDLRGKAQLYRARSLGTFFSRSYFDDLEEVLAKWETDSAASSSRGAANADPHTGDPQAIVNPPLHPQEEAALDMQRTRQPPAAAPMSAAAVQRAAGNPAFGNAALTAGGGSEASSAVDRRVPGYHGPRYAANHSSPSSVSSVSSLSSHPSSVSSKRSQEQFHHQQRQQQQSGAHGNGAGDDSGRVSTPNLPSNRPRHHLDRTTPGHPVGILLESPERPHPRAHGQAVSDPLVRSDPQRGGIPPRASATTAPAAGTRNKRSDTARRPARSSTGGLQRATASKPGVPCTCGAEVGPGPYHQRYQRPHATQATRPQPSVAKVQQAAAGAARKTVAGGRVESAVQRDDGRQRRGFASHAAAAAAPPPALAALARTRAPLCDSLSSLSSQGSAAAQVLQRAKQRQDTFWNPQRRHAPPTNTVAAH